MTVLGYFKCHTERFETDIMFRLLHIVPAAELHYLLHHHRYKEVDILINNGRISQYSPEEFYYWRFNEAVKPLMLAIRYMRENTSVFGCGIYGDELTFVVQSDDTLYELDFKNCSLKTVSEDKYGKSRYEALMLRDGNKSIRRVHLSDNPIISNLIRILEFCGYKDGEDESQIIKEFDSNSNKKHEVEYGSFI